MDSRIYRQPEWLGRLLGIQGVEVELEACSIIRQHSPVGLDKLNYSYMVVRV